MVSFGMKIFWGPGRFTPSSVLVCSCQIDYNSWEGRCATLCPPLTRHRTAWKEEWKFSGFLWMSLWLPFSIIFMSDWGCQSFITSATCKHSVALDALSFSDEHFIISYTMRSVFWRELKGGFETTCNKKRRLSLKCHLWIKNLKKQPPSTDLKFI